jgi:hypothetical protein
MEDVETIATLTLEGLYATVPGGADPVSEFESGKKIELHWQSSGNSFEVYAADRDEPVHRGTKTGCVIDGFERTTTLIVVASLGSGAEPVRLYEAITVTISDPTIAPAEVLAGKLDVTGKSTVKDLSTAAESVAGNLTVGGKATVDALDVVNLLSVLGKADLAATTIAELTVTGSVQMLAPTTIPKLGKQYRAKGDGLVLGTIERASDPKMKCYYELYAKTDGGLVASTVGGNFVAYENSEEYAQAVNPSSLTLPVRAGETVVVTSTPWEKNEVSCTVTFWWIPFGPAGVLEELTAEEAAALDLEPPEFTPPAIVAPNPEPMIDQLLDLLTEAIGRPLAEEQRQRFAQAVRELAIPPDAL